MSKTCWELLGKQDQSHKRLSLIDSYTWIDQCWVTNKKLQEKITFIMQTLGTVLRTCEEKFMLLIRLDDDDENSWFEFNFPSLRLVAQTKRPTTDPLLVRIDGSMPFQKTIARSELQTSSSRIWTCIVDFMSQDGNHCTKNVSCSRVTCHDESTKSVTCYLETSWASPSNFSIAQRRIAQYGDQKTWRRL